MLDVHVTLQFHPDWPFGDGVVIEAIARDGRYRSQFETGTSNGGLTAHAGGDRWRWESRLFGGRYDGADHSRRPVYGALNFDDNPYGGSVRFGSACLRLREEVTDRCTFCFPDSVFEPEATWKRLSSIPATGAHTWKRLLRPWGAQSNGTPASRQALPHSTKPIAVLNTWNSPSPSEQGSPPT